MHRLPHAHCELEWGQCKLISQRFVALVSEDITSRTTALQPPFPETEQLERLDG